MSEFYLSESTLKDLGLLPPNFLTLTSQQNMVKSNKGKVPPKPTDVSFAPT